MHCPQQVKRQLFQRPISVRPGGCAYALGWCRHLLPSCAPPTKNGPHPFSGMVRQTCSVSHATGVVVAHLQSGLRALKVRLQPTAGWRVLAPQLSGALPQLMRRGVTRDPSPWVGTKQDFAASTLAPDASRLSDETTCAGVRDQVLPPRGQPVHRGSATARKLRTVLPGHPIQRCRQDGGGLMVVMKFSSSPTWTETMPIPSKAFKSSVAAVLSCLNARTPASLSLPQFVAGSETAAASALAKGLFNGSAARIGDI